MSVGYLTVAYRSVVNQIDGYVEARAYAEGASPILSFIGHDIAQQIKATKRDDEREHTLNFARLVLAAVDDRLEISAIEGPDDKSTNLLNEVWDANDMGLTASDAMWGACRDGDGYIGLVADVDAMVPEDIQLVVEDAETIHIHYDNTGTEKLWLAKVWQEQTGGYDSNGYAYFVTRLTLWYPETVERWSTRVWLQGNPIRVMGDEDFIPYIAEAEAETEAEANTAATGQPNVEVNAWGFIPFVHLRTERPYGRPLHRDAMPIIDAINLLSNQLLIAVDFSGTSQKWALSDDSNRNVYEQDPLAAAEAGVPAKPPRLESGPGKVWWLRNIKAVGEFSATLPAAYLDPLIMYIRNLAAITFVPVHLLELAGARMPSGESLRAAEAPLRKRVEKLQRMFGAAWGELFTMVLEVLGIPGEADVEWAPAATYDDSDSLDNAQKKLDMGIPFIDVMTSMGVPYAQAVEWDAARTVKLAHDAELSSLRATVTQLQPQANQPLQLPPGNGSGGQ
jgi:hypothetical protein